MLGTATETPGETFEGPVDSRGAVVVLEQSAEAFATLDLAASVEEVAVDEFVVEPLVTALSMKMSRQGHGLSRPRR